MSLPVGTPAIMPLPDVAARLGVSRVTLWRWLKTDPKLRSCIALTSSGKTWLSTQRLIDLGLLLRPEPRRGESTPVMSFTYETKTRAS